MAPTPRKVALPAAVEAGVGRGAEVPVAVEAAGGAAIHPGQLPVGHVDGQHGLRQRQAVGEVAIGRVEHHQSGGGQQRARRPHAAAPVVQHVTGGVHVGLQLPHRPAGVEAGRGQVAALVSSPVHVHPEEHLVAGHDRRREDPGAVLVGVGGLLRATGVVVAPVQPPGVGVEGVEGVPAGEDDQIGACPRSGLVPGRRRDQPAVGGGVAGVLTWVRGHRVLAAQPVLPAQGPGAQVEGVEGVVPRSHVHRAVHHRGRGADAVTRGEEPGHLQGGGAGRREGGASVEGVLGIVAVGGPVPPPGLHRVDGGGRRRRSGARAGAGATGEHHHRHPQGSHGPPPAAAQAGPVTGVARPAG